MNIAVIGRGKTGQAVIDSLDGHDLHIFHSQHPATEDALASVDIAIVFVNASTMDKLLPILIAAKCPVVCGTTGFQWPSDLSERVKAPWVLAHNFSLSMTILEKCLHELGKLNTLLPNAHFQIDETHHLDKKDAPSGTAIHWKDWLGVETKTLSHRLADSTGSHELSISTDFEKVTLRHDALDRRLFAQGAVWAAEQLLAHPSLPNQVLNLSNLMELTR